MKRHCEEGRSRLAVILGFINMEFGIADANVSCTTTVVGTLAGHFIYETYFGPIVTQVNPDRFKNLFRTMSSATHKYKSPFNLNSIA